MNAKDILPYLCLGTIAPLAAMTVSYSATAATNTALPTEPLPADATPTAGEEIAQFFPFASPENQVVMIQGTGTATATAETAEVELVFLNYDPYYDPYACYYEESDPTLSEPTTLTPPPLPTEPCPPPGDPVPLTRDVLQPAIDALQAGGVPASAIEVRLPSDSADDFGSYYYTDSASISFDLNRPSRQGVEDLMTAVDDAIGDAENLYLQDRYVQYTLSQSGCQALQREAYQSAVADARDRAAVLAAALGVGLGDVPSVADSAALTAGLFSSYPSYCDTAFSPSPYPYPTPSYYDPNLPAEVQLQRSIFVTFPVER